MQLVQNLCLVFFGFSTMANAFASRSYKGSALPKQICDPRAIGVPTILEAGCSPTDEELSPPTANMVLAKVVLVSGTQQYVCKQSRRGYGYSPTVPVLNSTTAVLYDAACLVTKDASKLHTCTGESLNKQDGERDRYIRSTLGGARTVGTLRYSQSSNNTVISFDDGCAMTAAITEKVNAPNEANKGSSGASKAMDWCLYSPSTRKADYYVAGYQVHTAGGYVKDNYCTHNMTEATVPYTSELWLFTAKDTMALH